MRSHRLFSSLLASLCLGQALPLSLLAADSSSAAPATSQTASDGAKLWLTPQTSSKPWTFWWWPGLSLTKEDITAELTRFAKAGYGGVTVVPIYGVKGEEAKALPFLSEGHIAMLQHAASEAKRLGLELDMSTTTGWPFGGPNISAEDAELKVAPGTDSRLVVSPTRFKVKRAAPGAEGLVIDPYSTTAMEHYLQRFDKALRPLPAGLIRSQYHDSFEYQANWSNALPPRFLAMHGYDIKERWDAFSGIGDTDTVARVKYDYRQTLTALHLDYINTWVRWSHEHGYLTREQAHGSPGGLLDLYAAADIPETECFGASQFPIPGFRPDTEQSPEAAPLRLLFRFASSAGHVAGRPLIASETFTWLRDHFNEAPSQMKPELDQLFLAGINHVVYHGACYSPDSAAWPGWLFYASTEMNSRNPLWSELDGLHGYLTRVETYLQASEADNDLLVYWPEEDIKQRPDEININMTAHRNDWLRDAPYGRLAEQLVNRGVNFDFVSALQLSNLHASADKGILPAGAKRAQGYRAILVPKTRYLEPESLAQLLRLASEGVTVLFEGGLPEDVPGLGRLEERRARFQQLLASIKLKAGSSDTVSRQDLGSGHLVLGTQVDALLGAAPLRIESSATATGLSVARHSHQGQPLYLLVNNGGKAIDAYVDFATPVPQALLLNPVTGRGGLAQSQPTSHGSSVHVQLQPGETRLLLGVDAKQAAALPAWPYLVPAGNPIPLQAHWTVSFLRGGPSLPASFETDSLGSWTTRGGDYERFSGTAAYETRFELPANVKADDWLLDLGDLREVARVTVNGETLPIVWSLPFRTRIGEKLHAGSNTLRIEVTNLGANRIRDLDLRKVSWKIFRDINIVSKSYHALDASRWEPAPSGLLSPVMLVPLKKE